MIRVARCNPLPFLLAVTLACIAGQAHAGPWPRDKGEGFLSTSVDAKADDGSDPFLSIYVEYGLARGRTIGLERYQNEASLSKSIVFMRWPILRPENRMRFAFEMGAGLVDGHAALRPGLHFGKGLDWGRQGGWFSMSSRAVIYEDYDHSLLESDITFGWKTGERVKSILQLQAGAPLNKDAYLKLAPSLVYQHTERRSYTLGLIAGVINATDLKLSLGLWQKF